MHSYKSSIQKRQKRLPNSVKEEPKTQVDMVETFLGEGAVNELLQKSEIEPLPKQETVWRIGEVKDAINRMQVDYLAHSYLYYHLNISLMTDTLYDHICGWLVGYKKEYPEDFRNSKYYDLCKHLDESGSGFYLSEADYPLYIKEICKRLILQHNQEVPPKLEKELNKS